MSVMMTPESGVRPRGRDRLLVSASVVLARGLAHMPPRLLVRLLAQVVRGRRYSTRAEALAVRGAVCATSQRCAGQAGCLQRSIAVVLACAAAGHAPGWRSGFRVDPFVSHAWVAVGGAPVGEPDDVAEYTVLLAADPEVPR